MKVEIYDFRKPGRLTSEFEQRFAAWLRSAALLLQAKWSKHMSAPLDVTLAELQTSSVTSGLDRLPDLTVCHQAAFGEPPAPSIFAFPRELSLAVLAGIMGDSPSELPADRALTPVEESLWNYLLNQLTQVLVESWPGHEPLPLAIGSQLAQPKRSRLLPPDENLLVMVFSIGGSFGKSDWFWLVPLQRLIEQLTRTRRDGAARDNLRPALETLVGEIPLELCVTLGSAELPVSQLTRLRSGDLVVLDQKVSEPLKACIDGEARFHVWAGRIGPRKAFQIESLVDS